ncbi:MAG: 5'-3' exonuclease H3TH domain-containing protein [Polyangiaceae bacterium]
MTATLHLVDATYELFRAFFGAPARKAPDGREVGAVRGLLGTLLMMLKSEGATHVACATDHVIRSFRNELWAGYKTEEGMAVDLASQFHLAEDLMRALGLVVWPMVEFEADDALAAGVARFAKDAEKIFVCTVDKDLAQCVDGDRVVLVDRMRKKTTDEAGVVEKFGVRPAQIPDFLALVGDTADGYPGIAGFGKKTAATVVTAFGSIEEIPSDPARWPTGVRGAPNLAATLDAAREHALLFKRLATLRRDVPLTERYEDLEWRGARPELRDRCEELGFKELPARVHRWR